MADIDWTSERRLCLRQNAGIVEGPRRPVKPEDTLGPETDAKPLTEVMDRKWWWQTGGIYTIRDEHGTVMYVGITNAPLGARLRLATMRRPMATWAEHDYKRWTVSLRRGTEDDLGALRATLKPALMRGGGGPVVVRTVSQRTRQRLLEHVQRLATNGETAAAAAVQQVADEFEE